MPRWLQWLFRRPHRGAPPAGISLACGYGKRNAFTGTSQMDGMTDATPRAGAECSSYSRRGGLWADTVTLQAPPDGSSFTVLTDFGNATAAVGESGQPPLSAA